MGCFFMLLLALAILEVVSVSSQGVESAPGAPQHADVLQVTVTPTVSIGGPSSTFQITLAELDYEEEVLDSPYDATEYTLHLPEGWELGEGSVIELDFSYTYNRIGSPETETLPSLFGDIIVVVDRQTQLVFPIEEATLEHSHLRINLPLPLLNDPARNVHSIEVTLDASPICEIPHIAHLIIHPTSLFSLVYNQLPVTADLALYPRPFYQRAFFESDQVRFVLPAQPAEAELAGAVAVAARLGELTYRMIISGTTDLELLDRLEAGEAPHEHLIVIGKPESNEVILKLNQLGVLPVPLQERQLSLAGEGLAVVTPGGILTYTLTLANTTQDTVSSLSLSDALPAHTHLVACSPPCTEGMEGREVNWSIPSLEAGEALSYALELRLSEVISDSTVENTVTLLDAASNPQNVNTLTTTISSAPLPESGPNSSVSTEDGYFFLQGDRAVPEGDGIVQEIVSPWDRSKAILVITGLDDEAVYKASQAMSFESHFPGMKGPLALIREVRLLPESPPESRAADLTFADLGHEDRVLWGATQNAWYYFDIPWGWELTKAAYLELHLSHSQTIRYEGSWLTVFFNYKPLATISLSDETLPGGKLRVELPASVAEPGQTNEIRIEIEMQPLEKCSDVAMWSMISSESLLHLDHTVQADQILDLDFYPIPFNRRPDLSDVLFVLPAMPQTEEWENTLQLAAALGSAAGGSRFVPAVASGEAWPETELGGYHLLAIGRPSRNPLLQRVNAQLPQPFLPGSDRIEQRVDEVILRLPADVSLGYVQLIPSPWNESQALLAVTGTSDEGVTWATRSLLNSSLRQQLEGDLALIRDQEIQALDTRKLTRGELGTAVSTAVPELTLVVTVTPTATPTRLAVPTAMPAAQSSEKTRPGWLIPLVVVTILTVVIIFAVTIRRSLWRRR
jgi:uncharacterized repeat protein (TIGR01451 family)